MATHYIDGVSDVVTLSRVDGDLCDEILIRIECAVRERLSDGLKDGFVGLASLGIRTSRRCEAVDDKVDLAEVGFDRFNGLRLDLVRKGVAVNTFGVKSCFVGCLFEGNRIIPTCAGRFAFHRGALEKNAEGGSIMAESSGDPA